MYLKIRIFRLFALTNDRKNTINSIVLNKARKNVKNGIGGVHNEQNRISCSYG